MTQRERLSGRQVIGSARFDLNLHPLHSVLNTRSEVTPVPPVFSQKHSIAEYAQICKGQRTQTKIQLQTS